MEIKIRNRSDEEMQLRKKELFEITDLLNKEKIFHFLWGGALLGIRRDGKLLEWDWDVEIGIFSKDLNLFTSCHYLVTDGKMEMLISKNKFKICKGDSIWVCPNQNHGFRGKGSLIRISNGEAVDYLDMIELSKLYNPKHTLKRLYKDKFNWGYDN